MKERIDDILKQLSEEERIRKESDGESLAGKSKRKIKSIGILTTSAIALSQLAWRFIYPIYAILYFIVVDVLWKVYSPVWNKFAYTAEGAFSKTRGGITILSSIVGLWLLYGFMFFAFDVVLYAATARVDEVVYLSNAQEIIPEENVHSVQGCEVEAEGEVFSCSPEKSLYFRIDPDTFSTVWSLLSNGTLFYPDYVAATIAPGWEKCTITSYGFRMKIFLRGFDIYPMLLSANCGKV